ncbi:CBS domain-containing protein CBSX6-like [Canna indica]|uniref:CBS domain-containing protein CBSX6-like n=1 Tax=Canna indica TaxID=4628 RepID=A0AAQ3KF87_9LILI|nr:CBS domain-containing protein CBSX6-like [Canna indica]
MALVFLHHVGGGLTLGKPDFVQFFDAETVESFVCAIADSAEGSITVWCRTPPDKPPPPPSADRFVGILNSLEVVAFLARAGTDDQEKAMRTPVSELVTPNPNLLKEASNYRVAACPERPTRHQFEKELISSAEVALGLLIACLSVDDLKEQVLEAFASWIRLCHGWFGTLAEERKKMEEKMEDDRRKMHILLAFVEEMNQKGNSADEITYLM